MGNTWKVFVLVVMTIVLISGCHLWWTHGGGSSQSHHYQLNAEDQCQSATGQATVCTVIITNDASSTDDFNWEATSDPGVASIDPSSGTVPRGSSSGEITVTVPSGSPCPVTVTFTDSGTNGSTNVQVNSVDGQSC